jgi:photosystem II stability/assembly factor-like uncharacterized protein
VGAENYGTLAYIMESPHEKGVIYTGSDDGLVYLTRDGGATWKNVTPKGLAECLINAIEVSPHDRATVYIATTRYKFNDHTTASRAMRSRASYVRTMCAAICCLPARSWVFFFRGMAERTGRRFS